MLQEQIEKCENEKDVDELINECVINIESENITNKDNFRNKKYSGKNNFSIVVGSVTYIGSGGVKFDTDTNNALIAIANDPDHADYINTPATCGIFDATTDAGVVTVVEFTLVP